MAEWNVAQPLDYSATGDDIDSASQKIIATFVDVYDKLNRLRSLDASAEHTVGDAAAYSIKIDTSVTPAAILMRNAANTGYIQIGSVAENMGVTAKDVGAIQGDGMGKISLGAEANLPSTATTYDLYFAYDTGRLYMYRTGAWRVFLSLRFEDLLGVEDAVITRDEVAANGANKIPQLNSVGQGEFDITGSAAKIGGKNLYLPEIPDGCVLVFNATRDRWEVAARDDITNADVSTTGEPNKIVKADATGAIANDTKGNAAKIATKTIDVSNLQDGDVLVYDATHGTFVNKQGAVVNAQGVVEANVSGSAAKWGGKVIQTVSLTDGQILVWSESNQAFINRNQGSIGSARSLVINQDGEEKANYNGDTYRNINIITPHLRVASQEYTANQTCFSKNMASTLYLECTTPGVTAAVEPDFSSASIGDTVADGGVVWTVRGYVDTTVTDAIRTDVTALQSIQTHNYRQPNTTYTAGQIKYHSALPTGWYLECTTPGTSSSGELTISSPSIGGTVTDGTVTWTVSKDYKNQNNSNKTDINNFVDDGYYAVAGFNDAPFYGYPGCILVYRIRNSADEIQTYQLAMTSDQVMAIRSRTNAATWRPWINITTDVNSERIVAKSLGANGYIKYASGLILQWGQVEGQTGVEYYDIFFPVTFSSLPICNVTLSSSDNFYASFTSLVMNKGTVRCSGSPISIKWFAIGY